MASPALTGKEFVAQTARALGLPPRDGTFGRMMFRLGGLSNVDARESVEMLNRCEHPHLVDSTNFYAALGFIASTCTEAVRQTVAALRKP